MLGASSENELDPDVVIREFFEPTSAKRWISSYDAKELYLRGSFGITISYLVLSIIASRTESIRATQYPNVIGFHAVLVWKIVANVYFTMDLMSEHRDNFTDLSFIRGREIVAIAFTVLTFISIFWFYRLGEANF